MASVDGLNTCRTSEGQTFGFLRNLLTQLTSAGLDRHFVNKASPEWCFSPNTAGGNFQNGSFQFISIL